MTMAGNTEGKRQLGWYRNRR